MVCSPTVMGILLTWGRKKRIYFCFSCCVGIKGSVPQTHAEQMQRARFCTICRFDVTTGNLWGLRHLSTLSSGFGYVCARAPYGSCHEKGCWERTPMSGIRWRQGSLWHEESDAVSKKRGRSWMGPSSARRSGSGPLFFASVCLAV